MLTKKSWDDIFTEGATFTPLNELFLDALLKTLSTNTEPIKTVVDLGCGTGEAAIKFSKRGYSVQGVDFSDVAIKKAQDKGENVEFSKMNLDNPSYIEPKDLVHCRLVFAFIEDKKKFLKFVKNTTKKSGVFVLTTPVLHENIMYTKEDKPHIAVPLAELVALLNAEFSSVRLFDQTYFGERGDIQTFICTYVI